MRYRVLRKSDGRMVAVTNYLVQAVAEVRYYGPDEHEIRNAHDEVVVPKRNYWIYNHHTHRTEQRLMPLEILVAELNLFDEGKIVTVYSGKGACHGKLVLDGEGHWFVDVGYNRLIPVSEMQRVRFAD